MLSIRRRTGGMYVEKLSSGASKSSAMAMRPANIPNLGLPARFETAVSLALRAASVLRAERHRGSDANGRPSLAAANRIRPSFEQAGHDWLRSAEAR